MQDHTPPANRGPRPDDGARPAHTEPDASAGRLTTVGAHRRVRVAGRWYYLVTIATAGLFAWVPFLHAARKLHSAKVRRLAMLYGGLDALFYVLLAITPQNSQSHATGTVGNVINTVVGLLAIGIVVVGCIQQSSVRRMVYEGAPADDEDQPSPVDPAVKAALAARARRDEARRLATDDPLLARELHIGRPDMSADYDDGGLIDLNSAPGPLIAEVCGIPAEVSATIVDARTQRGEPFSNVDEVFVMADLPVSTWDRIRDRAVLLP